MSWAEPTTILRAIARIVPAVAGEDWQAKEIGPIVERNAITWLVSVWILCLAAEGAVCLRVSDLSPTHGRAGPHGPVGLIGMEMECTAGERWQAVEFTMLGPTLRPEHVRPVSPSLTDKHGRLRDHSGFSIFRLTHDDGGFSASNALPSQNDKPVTLTDAKAVDLSRWPRVRIALPPQPGEEARRQRFAIAIRLARKPPVDGTSFRARLDRVVFDRNTPWMAPLVTRPLVVDTSPPALSLACKPASSAKPGQPFTLTVNADEPLACPPQVIFRPKGAALANDNRGRPMNRHGRDWQLTLRPLRRLTPNGAPENGPVSYTTWPQSIRPRYADDGRKLLDGECRPSWFVGKALQWRNTERVDIVMDLGRRRSVEAARIWVSYLQGKPLVTCETAVNADGPWQAAAVGRPPVLGRGRAFSQPVNSVWLDMAPRDARFVRFRLTEHPGPQVTEVEVFGEPGALTSGTWEIVVRAWDLAWNHTTKTQLIKVKR